MRQMLAVDYEFCTGCHTCEIACQQEHGLAPDRFGIKLTQIGPDQITERKWQYEFVPVPTDRCDRCARRQAAGKPPTCVQHCQAGCLYCGTLEELAEKIDLGKKKLALFSQRLFCPARMPEGAVLQSPFRSRAGPRGRRGPGGRPPSPHRAKGWCPARRRKHR